MMMRSISCFLLGILFSVPAVASETIAQLYQRLDSTLARRAYYAEEKERQIAALKQQAGQTAIAQTRLFLYDRIVEMYTAFNYDSAMVYIDKGSQLARLVNDRHYTLVNEINRCMLYNSRGYYPASQDIMRGIQIDGSDRELLFRYNFCYSRLYTYLHDYYSNTQLSHQCDILQAHYLKEAIRYDKPNTPRYSYLLASYYNYVDQDLKKCEHYYREAIRMSKSTDRHYAMSAYSLCLLYKKLGQMDDYERLLIQAAISDQMIPVRENVALQDLALLIYTRSDVDLKKAQHYMNTALNDAQLYGNRLRSYEIMKKFPVVSQAYQQRLDRDNRQQTFALMAITLLTVGLIVLLLLLQRQANLLRQQKQALTESNRRLKLANENQESRNEQLSGLNQRHEDFGKYIIDLCARYLSRLNEYHQLVKLKVKVNQTRELANINPMRISDDERAQLMNFFDQTILYLYPRFVEEFNELLEEPYRFKVSPAGTLTPELRIFALMRMGVKDATEASSLLFLSVRTVYNYKSETRGHAIRKETFEQDVMQLCRVR